MADKHKQKTLRNYQRNLILVDIKLNAEFIFETIGEIAEKIGVSESWCFQAKNNHKRIKKRYYIKNYRE